MNRRDFLTSTGATVFVSLGICQMPAKADDTNVSIEWRVFQDQVADIKKNTPLTEGKTSDTRNPLIIGAIVLVGAWALPKIAQAVLDVYYRYQTGGVIIDLRGTPLIIQTNPKIPPGTALVVTASGVQTISLVGVGAIEASELSEVLKQALGTK